MKKIGFLVLIGFLTCFYNLNPLIAADKAEKIDQLLQKFYEYEQFNGSVLVAEHGKIIFRKGYGLANMEWKIPNDPSTKFRLGSITKQFTAMLIMQLVQNGQIDLNARIIDYLPDYPKAQGEKVTIHHLLTHTSGIPSYTNLPDFQQSLSRNPLTPKELISFVSEKEFEFEPGTQYRYNNSGYFLLGMVIEKVTGKRYEQVLQEQILTPLDMKDSGYDHFQTILPKRAAGYQKSPGGFENADYLDMSLPYAASALYSTVADLYKWDQALYSEKLLDTKHKNMMFSPFLNHYAYGWGIRKIALSDKGDSLLSVSHGGGINGFNTLITRYPDDRHLIVLLNNTGGTRLDLMSTEISKILYDLPFALPKQPLALLFRSAISDVTFNRALKGYQQRKDRYAIDEAELNNLGYQFLGLERFKEAIAIFQINVENFSESANAYDSLAEAFLTSGDQDQAIRYYQKALEVNPNFENAKAMLAKLGVSLPAESGKEIKVAAEILQKYLGNYEIAPGFILTISLEGEHVMAQATGQPKVEIFAASETRFFYKVVDASIDFHVEASGQVSSLTLLQSGQKIVARKLK